MKTIYREGVKTGKVEALQKRAYRLLVQKCHVSFGDVPQGMLGVRLESITIPHYPVLISLSNMLLERNSEASSKNGK